jgi:hypothetical protein
METLQLILLLTIIATLAISLSITAAYEKLKVSANKSVDICLIVSTSLCCVSFFALDVVLFVKLLNQI